MSERPNQDYLEHYGVKGMRWRNRRSTHRTREGYAENKNSTPSAENREKGKARMDATVQALDYTARSFVQSGKHFLDLFFQEPPVNKKSKRLNR